MENQSSSAATATSGEVALSPAQGKVWRKTQTNVAQLKSAIEGLVEKTAHVIKGLPKVLDKQKEVKMYVARLQENLEKLRAATPGLEIPQEWEELATVDITDIATMAQKLTIVLPRLLDAVPEMVIVDEEAPKSEVNEEKEN